MSFWVMSGTPALHLAPHGAFWIVARFRQSIEFYGPLYRVPICQPLPRTPWRANAPEEQVKSHATLHLREVALPNAYGSTDRVRTVISTSPEELSDVLAMAQATRSFLQLL